MGLGEGPRPYAVGTGRGACSTEVNTADIAELQAVKGLSCAVTQSHRRQR